MIPARFITAWRQQVPWQSDFQVEQDLLISRALVELYQIPLVNKKLAFRGGTALNKLFITPPARFSEDIDLVQLEAGAIGPVINAIQDKLNVWFGKPKVTRWQGRVTLVYRFESEIEPKIPGRLKIEINTHEHFTCEEPIYKELLVDSKWCKESADVLTYQLNELAATKFRALYQRKKGRDLFDMELLLKQKNAAPKKIIEIFHYYLKSEGHQITRALFEKNLFEKMNSEMFLKDMNPLLVPTNKWDMQEAYKNVLSACVALLPGDSWKGKKEA